MTILLIDVYSIAHQIPKSMLRLTTSDGRISGHVYSFLKTLTSINSIMEFDTLFFILDGGHKTRDSIDSNYKSNRGSGSDIIEDIIPTLKFLPGFLVKKPGFEADDLIYTLCTLLHKRFNITILSKDYDISYNLIYSPKVRHFFNTQTEVTTYSLFMQYGCTPDKLPLYKAIYGDSSDNISSIKLPKKISQIVKEMFCNDDSAKEIIRNIPVEYKSKLLKNLQLVRPIFINEFNISNISKNRDGINAILDEYEIKSLSYTHIFSSIDQNQSNKVKAFLLNGK